jgi:DNA repair exonuclease SbcCD ATPase subunit
MKPIRLYIDNFMCHDKSFVDFSQFSAALIVGKIDNNELFSNGVGKTTVFKAIEYVLFNQADVNLEKIIRDDEAACQVTLDFLIGDQEFRVRRKRTKKGSTDLTLLQRTASPGEDSEVYHTITSDVRGQIYSPLDDEKFWKDISGRRAADTEKELEKLIKINFKAFRSTIHFIQNDLMGLPTATPEARKKILKEALNLVIYTKLEKIAKDKSNILSKDIEKHKTLIENLGNPNQDLLDLKSKLSTIELELSTKQGVILDFNSLIDKVNDKIATLNNTYSVLESKSSSLVGKEQVLVASKARLETSVKEYQSKKTNTIKAAKDLIDEVKSLKETQTKLVEVDYSQIDILNEYITNSKDKIAHHNAVIQHNISKYEELKIPVPDDSVCKHCRQPLSQEHKSICKSQIHEEMLACQNAIKISKKEIASLNGDILGWQQGINSLNLSKQQLEGINTKITSKNKEIQDKKSLHDEYVVLFEKFTNELTDKLSELDQVKEDLKNSSLEESKSLKTQIELEKAQALRLTVEVQSINKEVAHLNATRAVIQHTIDQKTLDKSKIVDLQKNLLESEEKFIVYPSVLQAFSSTGIPNLIIQNVLDDLQAEANELLGQLKPGLQLSFFVEKTVGKTGDQADTLDINYHINGKERYYEQLSGAQKLAVAFSLKLGLSFLLHKMIGTNIQFLLLDEIDQSLDKASVDAFADIVKFFQKDFIILVITHNDRLKDKFSHAILVEQDMNMVSRAHVVSSW